MLQYSGSSLQLNQPEFRPRQIAFKLQLLIEQRPPPILLEGLAHELLSQSTAARIAQPNQSARLKSRSKRIQQRLMQFRIIQAFAREDSVKTPIRNRLPPVGHFTRDILIAIATRIREREFHGKGNIVAERHP